MRLCFTAGLALGLAACTPSALNTEDANGADAATVEDAASGDSGASPSRGFFFDGPLDAGGGGPLRDAYQLLRAAGAATRSATIGTACSVGDDCAALGAGAACVHSARGGFCTRTCPAESDHCGGGLVCARTIVDVGICLPTCSEGGGGCAGALDRCSGPFFTFEFDVFPNLYSMACFPACSSDDECQPSQGPRVCSPRRGRCADPTAFLGRACHADDDCGDVGPTARCLRSPRDRDAGYCTTACVPGDPFGTGCVVGYARTSTGGAIGVRLKPCKGNADCQLAGEATCNFFRETNQALCSLRCQSDLDCASGTCDAASGNCQETAFWATECEADVNCTTGLCVSDFHVAAHRNCSRPCAGDADCQPSEVCVTSPSAHLESGGGFCAPSCVPGGASCADPSSRCLMPVAEPEIDFAGSASASGPFCWR